MSVYGANTAATLSSYESQYASSIRDVSSYWSKLAASRLDWYAPFVSAGGGGRGGGALSGSLTDGSVSWFGGGKLNMCHNAVDRYCSAPYNRGNEIAIIWEGDEPTDVLRITYDELRGEVCRISNALLTSGVRRGDVVTLYMPMVPELAMTMLACARIGAVHSVIFAGFSADAIADRIQDANSKYVVTASRGSRGGKLLPLKSICDVAITKERCRDIVEKVLVFDGRGEGGESWLEDEGVGKHVRFTPLVESMRPVCPCEWMDAEDPLFILYTSGSTGRPKGECVYIPVCVLARVCGWMGRMGWVRWSMDRWKECDALCPLPRRRRRLVTLCRLIYSLLDVYTPRSPINETYTFMISTIEPPTKKRFGPYHRGIRVIRHGHHRQ